MSTDHLLHILPPLRRHAQRQEPFIALTTYPDADGTRRQGMGGVFPAPLAAALARRALMIFAFDDEDDGYLPIADALEGAGAEGPWLAFAFFPLLPTQEDAEALMDQAGIAGHVEATDDGGFLCPPVVLAYALSKDRVRRRLWHLARQREVTETWVDFDGALRAHSELTQPPWFRARLRRVLMAAEADVA